MRSQIGMFGQGRNDVPKRQISPKDCGLRETLWKAGDPRPSNSRARTAMRSAAQGCLRIFRLGMASGNCAATTGKEGGRVGRVVQRTRPWDGWLFPLASMRTRTWKKGHCLRAFVACYAWVSRRSRTKTGLLSHCRWHAWPDRAQVCVRRGGEGGAVPRRMAPLRLRPW